MDCRALVLPALLGIQLGYASRVRQGAGPMTAQQPVGVVTDSDKVPKPARKGTMRADGSLFVGQLEGVPLLASTG